MGCCAINCHYNKRKQRGGKGLQTFSFPKDPKFFSQWKRAVGVKEIGKDTRVCQLHFRDHCFVTPGKIKSIGKCPTKRLKLKENAVPTIFHFGPPKRLRKTTSLSENDTLCNAMTPKITKTREHNYDNEKLKEKKSDLQDVSVFMCVQCQIKFMTKSSLVLHIAKFHGVKCSKCEQKFSSTEALKEHFLSNHDIDPTFFSKNDSDIPIERKVQRYLMKTNSMKNYDMLENDIKSAKIDSLNEKAKPARFELPQKPTKKSEITVHPPYLDNFHKISEKTKNSKIAKDLAELLYEELALKNAKGTNSSENKVTNVIKTQWNGKYSCMVVNGKTYRLSEEQKKQLDAKISNEIENTNFEVAVPIENEIANEIIETKTSDRIVEQEYSNEMIEKTPEERIKELESKLSLLSRENEAYKKILNAKAAKKSMESTSRNFGPQKRSKPKGDIQTGNVPMKVQRSEDAIWVSSNRKKLSSQLHQPKPMPLNLPDIYKNDCEKLVKKSPHKKDWVSPQKKVWVSPKDYMDEIMQEINVTSSKIIQNKTSEDIVFETPEEFKKDSELISQNYITHDSDYEKLVKRSPKKKVWVSPKHYIDEIMQEIKIASNEIVQTETSDDILFVVPEEHLKQSESELSSQINEINRNSSQKKSWVSPQDYMDEIIQEINKNDTKK